MKSLWDYDEKMLEKSEEGRIKILERKINYGLGGKKIKLADVKKYWDRLNLFHLQKRLFEILLWKKYSFTPRNKK